MKYGINMPPFGNFGDARILADLAGEAEAAGWDGFFIWDHIVFDPSFHPMVDPWVGLAAVAMSTSRIRLGTMLTPLPRRRPWKLARETASLDRLSDGRLILGVGIGDPVQWEFGFFDEEVDAKVRAGRLDEGLDVLTGLWRGEPFTYEGEHYRLDEVIFLPTPAQPRVPIWVGGWWPNKPPMRRAARWDGAIPGGRDGPLTPVDWREIRDYIAQHRAPDREPGASFDLVHSGTTSGTDRAADAAVVKTYAEAGVNWWLESVDPWRFGQGEEDPWSSEYEPLMRERILNGPPELG